MFNSNLENFCKRLEGNNLIENVNEELKVKLDNYKNMKKKLEKLF